MNKGKKETFYLRIIWNVCCFAHKTKMFYDPQKNNNTGTLRVTFFLMFCVLLSGRRYVGVTVQFQVRLSSFCPLPPKVAQVSFSPYITGKDVSLINHQSTSSTEIITKEIITCNFHPSNRNPKAAGISTPTEKHFINYTSAAPAVRYLQAPRVLCHHPYAHPRYLLWISFSLCCTRNKISQTTNWATPFVYYSRQGQDEERE